MLIEATRAGGKTGDAAIALALVLHPHFLKEEEYALPPLGLLPSLADGKTTREMSDVLCLVERLKADVPGMLKEHEEINLGAEKLSEAAKSENKENYAEFTEKLALHAKHEEEVLYPAAILVGEYLKTRLPVAIKAA
jgi:hypothetical protein